MSSPNLELVCWNVHGLNSPAKKKALREFTDTTHPAIFCIQETKLACIDDFTVMQCLGPAYDGFAYLPAIETRGGILVAWNS
uniref:Endonuclease/exonuclease/phosphatase domain-containing protein n=1 Tax=Aegilops tauschii subsp. strangulata TaxID=200361 RepID=A0A453JT49_AEGTS